MGNYNRGRPPCNNMVDIGASNFVIKFMLVWASCMICATGGPVLEKMQGPYKVLRIVPANQTQLDLLVTLWRNATVYDLDFWHSPSRIDGPVDVMVGPSKLADVQKWLREHDLKSVVTISDVEKLIERKQDTMKIRKLASSSNIPGNFSRRLHDAPASGAQFSLSQYHSYAEVQQYLSDLQRRFPHLALVMTIGQTHEGRAIQLLKIGYPATNEPSVKRAFWIDGGIHAREWVAPSTTLYFIDQLLSNYDSDPVIRQYVDTIDWYILPVVNPDGYEFSRGSDHPKVRLWRKNRSPTVCRWGNGGCCEGVDLNRNFDFHWGEVGASQDPCDEIYSGTSAFSEPETRAVRDFIAQRPSRFDGFITLHSYSQIWMYPWGHRRRTYPTDHKDLQTVAIQAKRALQANFGTKYIVGTGADTLYPASGGSDDWAKEKFNIKYVYLIELRPEEHVWDGFILDESQIIPTAKETWDGVKIVADAILELNSIKPLRPAPQRQIFTSGTCVEHRNDCGLWKKLGLCSWVIDSCKVTCGLC